MHATAPDPSADPRIAIALAVAFAWATLAAGSAPQPVAEPPRVDRLLQQADTAFARRGGVASSPVRLDEAALARSIALLDEALAQAPDRLDVRARLLRVLLFEGEYVATSEEEKKAVFERGRRIFDQGREQLRDATGERDLTRTAPERLPRLLADEPAAGSLFFWGAVHYGLWAEYYGSIAAVRKGLAKGLWRMGNTARALDPKIDGWGPSRFLGRLHHLTPRIPLVTGWADRRVALQLLEEAWREAPEEPLNGLFYAQALHELADDTEQARDLLIALLDREPRPDRRFEDTEALERCRKLLERLAGRSEGP